MSDSGAIAVLLGLAMACAPGTTRAEPTAPPASSPATGSASPFADLTPPDLPEPVDSPPSIPPTAGVKIRCGELPMPGQLLSQHDAHDCWAVRQGSRGNVDRFFAGGHDRDEPSAGILAWGGFGTDEKGDYYRVERLDRHGDLTVTLGRLDYACVRAADGTRWEFVVARRSFVAAPAGSRCAR